jgi:hypothetical protein
MTEAEEALSTGKARANNSFDASGGSVFRIMTGPAKLLGSAVARSTPHYVLTLS